MRVAVDASCLSWPSSGIRRYLERVLTHLAASSRLDLVLVTNASAPVSSITGVREIPRRVKSGALWRSTAFVTEVRKMRADVVWCPWPLAPLRSTHCPIVVTVHDISPLMHRGTKPWTSTLAMAVAGRRAVRRAARVVCVSQTTAADVARHWDIPSSRLVVVPHGVDAAFSPGDRDRASQAVQERWGVAPPYLLAVGSIEPRKGYDLLPPLAALIPDLPIVVAGRPGPLSEAIIPLLDRACRVIGAVTDEELLDLYRGAEALLVPSVYEGYGLTPIEAMACGTPAVVAQGSGATAAMLEGVMPVVPRDPRQWAVAIRAIIEKHDALSEAGLSFAALRGWEDVARETEAVLVGAVDGP